MGSRSWLIEKMWRPFLITRGCSNEKLLRRVTKSLALESAGTIALREAKVSPM